MQDIPQEQIDKRFQAIAESLQDAIFSEHTADAIRKTCVLREAEEQTPAIATLTGRVLLGYLQPESFAFEIQKETGIDALKATQVAHDIDTEIFSEVRLELKKLYPPTIQTPTVQAQGFIRTQPVATESPKPAPQYVVQIPERFKKTAPWQQQPTTDNAQLITNNKEVASREPEKSPANEAVITAPALKANEALEAKEAGVTMDPVVPLPTFIQSKFTNNAPLETHNLKPDAQDSSSNIQDSSKNDALKNAFGKFTVPSTATGVVKEPASPYREALDEPQKPSEQKPAAKIQGKVIDLSQF